MKPIKCPNCGKRMIAIERGNNPTLAWMACALDGGCGVRGPLADRKTGAAAVRIAARLTREWIARMETDKRDTETVRNVIRAWMDEHGHDYDVERANIVHALREFADRIERKNT